jgi:phosphoribosylformylglycinamidine synthase
MFIAEIKIELKRGVADPEGENTKKALKLLGFDEIETVKSVKLFEIALNTDNKEMAKERIEEMCNKLLANPVIHNYSIKLK